MELNLQMQAGAVSIVDCAGATMLPVSVSCVCVCVCVCVCNVR
jgi:hypothetical protein